jgi:hypothetical protein
MSNTREALDGGLFGHWNTYHDRQLHFRRSLDDRVGTTECVKVNPDALVSMTHNIIRGSTGVLQIVWVQMKCLWVLSVR